MKEDKRFKQRSEEEKKYIKRRLNIIEGQVRGVKQMIEDDRYCKDILIQLSAIYKSLKSVEEEILKNHLKECVVQDIKNNKLEVIDEVVELFRRMN